MKTSPGLLDLLKRYGITPTGDSKKDIELARAIMPTKYNKKDKK